MNYYRLMKIEILRPKEVFENFVKMTRVYVETSTGKVNPYIPFFHILMKKDTWIRGALFIKFCSTLKIPVPVPVTPSKEYTFVNSTMLSRVMSNPYVEATLIEASEKEVPKEDLEYMKEYYLVKRRIWKPLLKRGDLLEKREEPFIVKGKYATYLLQTREDLLEALTYRLTFLRMVEKLLTPRRWSIPKIARELYGEKSSKYRRRISYLMHILKEYRMAKYSIRERSWVLTLSKEELMKCLEALHLKRLGLADRVLARLTYVLLREKGYTHYKALGEVYPAWLGLIGEKLWKEKLKVKLITPLVAKELVEHGYLSEYEYRLAKEYGII